MNIKKVDDKPMIIHTKEKTKLHVKGAPEAKIKGRNILVVGKKPEDTGRVEIKENFAGKNHRSVTLKDKMSRKGIRIKAVSPHGKWADHENIRNVQQEKAACVGKVKSNSYQRMSHDRKKAAREKNDTLSTPVSVGIKRVLDQMEGGGETYSSYLVARNLFRPLENATDAGRQLYRRQAANAKEKKIKKVQTGKKINKKPVKDNSEKTIKKISKPATKATATMETSRETVGKELDKRDMRSFTRSRMIQLFVSKFQQKENQDSIGKTLKDITMMQFSMLAKHMVSYVGMFLLGVFALMALAAIPIITVIGVIYNSPFAIFFPSISSGDTTQDVLSAYVAEFNREINDELVHHSGYDTSEKVYVEFEGAGTPDNYCDVLAVYMVKYGNGDTATDMTDKAKQNLKVVFDDMCSYSISGKTDTSVDDEGNAATITIKEVNVKLKTYHDMISEYGFDSKEQEMLANLMNPEYLAMMGYTGGGGDSGETLSTEQYRAIMDSISDENGRKVVAYALSKVGYPYSQAYRDTGEYYDCSSLAYYAWQSAGVSIMYEGSNTAASEAKLCYDNNQLVNYDEMQPGDLIFYSYGNNGRFYNITHVAIYVGNGNVVEAANEKIGVVYRPVQGKSSIVFIGRPR